MAARVQPDGVDDRVAKPDAFGAVGLLGNGHDGWESWERGGHCLADIGDVLSPMELFPSHVLLWLGASPLLQAQAMGELLLEIMMLLEVCPLREDFLPS